MTDWADEKAAAIIKAWRLCDMTSPDTGADDCPDCTFSPREACKDIAQALRDTYEEGNVDGQADKWKDSETLEEKSLYRRFPNETIR